MFGIEKDFQQLMEQVYGPLGEKKQMTEKTNEPSGWNPVFEFPLDERDTIIIDGVKYKRVEEPKSPAEEAYKDWWGQYPETGTWDGFDEKRWQGFQAGYEFAYEEKVVEKVQEEQEDTVWKSVALRFGEKLSGYLSDSYYELSPDAWFRWAVFTYGKGQQKDYKVGVNEPSMTNCVLTGNPPNGYVAWNEWYNEMGSKGILHNLKISSKDYKPTPQERGERVHKEMEELVRESVKWCEEHPNENPLDWLNTQPNAELIEKFLEKKKEVNDELIEKVLKWTDKVLDGVDLNEELPDD